jgi:hypothetical protein
MTNASRIDRQHKISFAARFHDTGAVPRGTRMAKVVASGTR